MMVLLTEVYMLYQLHAIPKALVDRIFGYTTFSDIDHISRSSSVKQFLTENVMFLSDKV